MCTMAQQMLRFGCDIIYYLNTGINHNFTPQPLRAARVLFGKVCLGSKTVRYKKLILGRDIDYGV